MQKTMLSVFMIFGVIVWACKVRVTTEESSAKANDFSSENVMKMTCYGQSNSGRADGISEGAWSDIYASFPTFEIWLDEQREEVRIFDKRANYEFVVESKYYKRWYLNQDADSARLAVNVLNTDNHSMVYYEVEKNKGYNASSISKMYLYTIQAHSRSNMNFSEGQRLYSFCKLNSATVP